MRQIRYWGSYIGMTCGLTLLSSLFMTALSLLRGGMAELALTGIGMYCIPYLFLPDCSVCHFRSFPVFRCMHRRYLPWGVREDGS